MTRAGCTPTGLHVRAWACEAAARGAGEILLTSVDRDGTGDGYDLALVSDVSSAVGIPVIASGGVSNAQHLIAGVKAGADAVLAASIFHDGVLSVGDVKREMAQGGVAVRL